MCEGFEINNARREQKGRNLYICGGIANKYFILDRVFDV